MSGIEATRPAFEKKTECNCWEVVRGLQHFIGRVSLETSKQTVAAWSQDRIGTQMFRHQ